MTRPLAGERREHELPEDVVECLERYCDGRCPELAGNLFEELGERAVRAECGLERCTCASLLRHWFGIDQHASRQAEPSPHRRPPLLRLVYSRPRLPPSESDS